MFLNEVALRLLHPLLRLHPPPLKPQLLRFCSAQITEPFDEGMLGLSPPDYGKINVAVAYVKETGLDVLDSKSRSSRGLWETPLA